MAGGILPVLVVNPGDRNPTAGIVPVDVRNPFGGVPAAIIGLSPQNSRAQNSAALLAAVSFGGKLASGGAIIFDMGTYSFDAGISTTRKIRLIGQGSGTVINFVPTSSNDTFFTWTKVSANADQVNEEGQLDGPGVERIKFVSDRTIRANCLKFIGCDNVYLQDVFVFGFKGFSLNMQRSREWHISGYRTRYNGYIDTANAVNNVPDVLWASTDATGDDSNYTKTNNMLLIYPFGPALHVENSQDMDISNVMIHLLPQANTALETNFVSAITTYSGAAAAAGYDNSGVAKNEYAALHVSPGTSAASVSGRTWETPYRRVCGIYANDTDVRISGGELVGGLTDFNIWADNGARVDISNFKSESASATQYSSTFTFSGDTLTVSATCRETGTPCELTTSGTLPTGAALRTVYYIIKLSSTTCKLASSYANALAGTGISLSSGSGTHTLTTHTGYGILATGGSSVCVGAYGGVRIDNCHKAGYSDATSFIYGTPYVGSTFNQGPVMPQASAQQVLFIGKNIDFTSTSDQSLTKVFGGRRYVVTSVVAVCRSVSGTVGSPAGGIYTTTAKGGSTIVGSGQSWAALSAANKYVSATLATFATTDATAFAPLYLSLTTGSTATYLLGDVYIYGLPAD